MEGKLILDDKDFLAKVEAAKVWIRTTFPEEMEGVDMLKSVYQIKAVESAIDQTVCSVLFFEDDVTFGEFSLKDDVGSTICVEELASLLVMAGNMLINTKKGANSDLISVLARHRRQKALEHDGVYRDDLKPIKVLFYDGSQTNTIEC